MKTETITLAINHNGKMLGIAALTIDDDETDGPEAIKPSLLLINDDGIPMSELTDAFNMFLVACSGEVVAMTHREISNADDDDGMPR